MKKEIDIGFVILHYKTHEQTINCVNSIIRNLSNEYVITIVDNYSNNGSIEKVEGKFNNNKRINIIKSKENLGFAKGNNLGIEWINQNFNTKFIAVINNDTQLLNNNFYGMVEQEYKNSRFAVLGPKIRLLNNQINPIFNQDLSLNRALKRERFFKRQIIIRTLHLEKIYKIIKKLMKKKSIKKENLYDSDKYYKNVVLHGCFLIFSKDYFLHYSGFDDRTFLYVEEELLYLRIKKMNLVSVYNPKIEIFHEEDAATNISIPNDRKRAIFKFKNMYRSNKILIKEIREMEKVK